MKLVGSRASWRQTNPKRKRGTGIPRIPRLRFGLVFGPSARSGADPFEVGACPERRLRQLPENGQRGSSSVLMPSCRIFRYRLDRCRPSMRAASLMFVRQRSTARSMYCI